MQNAEALSKEERKKRKQLLRLEQRQQRKKGAQTPKKPRQPQATALLNDAESPESSEFEIEQSPTLEGIMHDDKLFLLDKIDNVVYSPQRDEGGELVRIGVWDPEARVCTPDVETGLAPELYPFKVDQADHCESGLEAFKHIVPVLTKLASTLKKTPAELRIYDPFFCTGAVVQHLGSLGFLSVYNRCEDFYKVQREGRVPPFDVLVTNPPYSEDHVEKLFDFAVKSQKPWMLLLPNYVLNKPFFMGLAKKPSFILPARRYLYRTPKGGRDKSCMRKDRKTSPFITFWYCDIDLQGCRMEGSSIAKKRTSIPGCFLPEAKPQRKKPKIGP